MQSCNKKLRFRVTNQDVCQATITEYFNIIKAFEKATSIFNDHALIGLNAIVCYKEQEITPSYIKKDSTDPKERIDPIKTPTLKQKQRVFSKKMADIEEEISFQEKTPSPEK